MHRSPYQDPLFWPMVQVSEQLCNASPQKPQRGTENGLTPPTVQFGDVLTPSSWAGLPAQNFSAPSP